MPQKGICCKRSHLKGAGDHRGLRPRGTDHGRAEIVDDEIGEVAETVPEVLQEAPHILALTSFPEIFSCIIAQISPADQASLMRCCKAIYGHGSHAKRAYRSKPDLLTYTKRISVSDPQYSHQKAPPVKRKDYAWASKLLPQLKYLQWDSPAALPALALRHQLDHLVITVTPGSFGDFVKSLNAIRGPKAKQITIFFHCTGVSEIRDLDGVPGGARLMEGALDCKAVDRLTVIHVRKSDHTAALTCVAGRGDPGEECDCLEQLPHMCRPFLEAPIPVRIRIIGFKTFAPIYSPMRSTRNVDDGPLLVERVIRRILWAREGLRERSGLHSPFISPVYRGSEEMIAVIRVISHLAHLPSAERVQLLSLAATTSWGTQRLDDTAA